MPYTTLWNPDNFFVEFSDEVTSAEIDAVNALFCGDERFDTVRYALWDMSHIAKLVMSESEIEYAAATDKGASVVKPRLRGAIVVPPAGPVREAVEKYLAIANELDTGWDTRLFDTVKDARQWLEN
jgi:hypothetical protein